MNHAPHSGSTESQPLDCQRNPWTIVFHWFRQMFSDYLSSISYTAISLLLFVLKSHSLACIRLKLFPALAPIMYIKMVVSVSIAQPYLTLCQDPLSMGFSRQEHWSGLPFPSPGDFPNPGIKLKSLASPALSGRFFRDKKENHTYLWKRTHSFCQAVICALVWSGLCHSII